jgi:hypothetical protein
MSRGRVRGKTRGEWIESWQGGFRRGVLVGTLEIWSVGCGG